MKKSFLYTEDQVIADSLKIRFYPIVVKSAKGMRVIDQSGQEYLDLAAGWAVANIGYGHLRMSQIKE